MAGILADWEQIKRDFAQGVATEIKTGSISQDYADAIKKLLTTDTGLTPALKDIDTAIAKKERKTAMTGLTKLHMVIEKIRKPIDDLISLGGNKATDQEKVFKQSKDPVDKMKLKMLNDLVETIFTYKQGILKLETTVAKAIEKVQEQKGPTGKKIDIISLEGDMKGALEVFKNAIKPFVNEEKTHKTLAKTDALVNSMKAYSKAAARTEVKNAMAALNQFFTAVGEIQKATNNVGRAQPPVADGYKKAVESFNKALQAIKSQRGDVSMKNLKQLESEGVS